jgi:hypothetical protein
MSAGSSRSTQFPVKAIDGLTVLATQLPLTFPIGLEPAA